MMGLLGLQIVLQSMYGIDIKVKVASPCSRSVRLACQR